ncbi:hypothetical protein QYE76_034797 [Lolium multiflorum]|uniref:RNase H type-1 domain-containing protein n=1 Tax=Lolium multiflorum TaxID=4521 RepID=A0AAD8R0C1_LOLMU|nr:hypothetical protein QYE76_034797 [Lolium multiflorum]
MDACAYLEEPIVMTFGEFRFGVNKEGSYRLEVPISSEFSAIDSNFSSSDEEFSSTYFVDNKASGKLAKIFSNTSFESSADSFISSDSDSVDSFNFIDKSAPSERLKEEDEAKTAFITPYGVFCYKTMPFGLKNAGATYQRMMQKCLATQIGKNVQVYIDDVVITSKKGSTLIEDLKETFDNLDKFCLKLNPTKCSFGVPAGELLGFLVSARGIEANPEKIQAIVTMRKPTKLKEIQQLTGRVAALSRFVARLGEKALPFYALIKQGEKFQWNEEADRAFENLKRAISTPPILVAPKEKEPLLLYIAATPQVVSTALVVEREEEGKLHGVQRPVYFISEVLSPSKQRYPQYQKLAYGVFTTARKLRHYFSAHPIIVVNEAPLSNILNNPEATGRVSLWGIELSPRDITYEKRKAIKSQVLPDFIAEWMELQNTGPPDLSRTWTMNFDGSKRLEGAGAGVILVSPEGDKLKYVLRMTFPNASNNEAEYEALIHGMKMAKACGATRLKIFGDSQLVAQQVMNQCDAVNESMIAYKEVYNELEKLFDGCEVNHISRMSNDEADVLANIGSQCLAIPPGVFWEEISERSTKPAKTKKEKKEKTSTVTKGTAEEEEEEQELVMMVRPQIRSAGRGIAKDCALLLLSVSTDTKKNPNGRVRYPINLTGTRQNGKTLSGACRSLHQYPEIMSRDVILK